MRGQSAKTNILEAGRGEWNSWWSVKCVDIRRNTGGEGDSLGRIPDAEVRKPGEQTGLDTPVVLAVNDGY